MTGLRKVMTKAIQCASAATAMAILAACGGGGGSSVTPPPPSGVVTTFAGTAGVIGTANGTGAAASFTSPSGVAVDFNGNLYVTQGNSTIRKISSTGVVTTLAGTAGVTGSTDGVGTAALFNNPLGIAVDTNSNVYVADTGNKVIRKISGSGTVTTVAGTAGVNGSADGSGAAALFASPNGIAVDTSGNLYVSDYGNSNIRKITSAGVVTTIAGTASSIGSTDGTGAAARFKGPWGIAVDYSGNIYVADFGNSAIRKITSSGVVTTIAGTSGVTGSADGTGAAASFMMPAGVGVDASGNVYVTDTFNSTVRKITRAGVVSTLAGKAGTTGSSDGTGSAARFTGPYGIAVDATGYSYIADSGNATIRKVSP
jgi:sugar lactone lactonase YvrE